jgi:Sel1 repeat-containing protein
MKRLILAVFCCASLLTNAGKAAADPVFDQDMASRYLRSAQSGDDEAQFYIAALYSAGVGVPRSDEEAFRWFSRAADQGHAHSMLILAGLYAVGRGVQKNNINAYKWAYIVNGASRIDEFRNGSGQLMGVLEPRMSPEEVNYARSEAGRWRPVVSSRPAQSVAPPAAAPPVTSAASPAPAPATVSQQPPAKTTSNDTSSPLDGLGKKGDVDNLLREVPSLRKKFGF